MKNLKLSMMSLAMILIFATTVSSETMNKTDPTASSDVTYIVSVDLSTVVGLCMEYSVVITDEEGNLVAPPQAYIEGTSNYEFCESGLITGKRIANLVETGVVLGPCSYMIETNPDVMNNRLRMSATYHFNLHPIVTSPDEYTY